MPGPILRPDQAAATWRALFAVKRSPRAIASRATCVAL